jgi:2-polyprenyl-3-methyl-5-hydroxy-6-metoxy-1,4-benzoquinol methylase
MSKITKLKQWYNSEEAFEQQYLSDSMTTKYTQIVAATLNDRYHPRKVLDIGCGGGALVNAWHSLGVVAYGVDISDYAIKHSPKPISNYLSVVDVDTELLPFNDETFDLVTILEVIEHLESSTLLINELRRVLKVHGTAFITTPILPFESGLWRTMGIQSQPLHINVHSKRYWTKLFITYKLETIGELPEIIKKRTALAASNHPQQHWVIKLIRTRFGALGERAGQNLSSFVAGAFLLQKQE